MNRSKILEFFNADDIKEQIHVVGTGAIGSNICIQLARIGVNTVHIYDFDTVSAHNITNQCFDEADIGLPKVEAIARKMRNINPEMVVHIHSEGLTEPYICNGYVFMCVDKIELRREIVEAAKYNNQCKAVFDFRMRLTDAQYYCAYEDWQYNELLNTMDFTHEEATESTPRSACGVELSVYYAPNVITSLGIANFIKLTQNEEVANMILIDMNTYELQNYTWKKRKKKESLGFLDKFL